MTIKLSSAGMSLPNEVHGVLRRYTVSWLTVQTEVQVLIEKTCHFRRDTESRRANAQASCQQCCLPVQWKTSRGSLKRHSRLCTRLVASCPTNMLATCAWTGEIQRAWCQALMLRRCFGAMAFANRDAKQARLSLSLPRHSFSTPCHSDSSQPGRKII